jgi:hypothetical protein
VQPELYRLVTSCCLTVLVTCSPPFFLASLASLFDRCRIKQQHHINGEEAFLGHDKLIDGDDGILVQVVIGSMEILADLFV